MVSDLRFEKFDFWHLQSLIDFCVISIFIYILLSSSLQSLISIISVHVIGTIHAKMNYYYYRGRILLSDQLINVTKFVDGNKVPLIQEKLFAPDNEKRFAIFEEANDRFLNACSYFKSMQ